MRGYLSPSTCWYLSATLGVTAGALDFDLDAVTATDITRFLDHLCAGRPLLHGRRNRWVVGTGGSPGPHP